MRDVLWLLVLVKVFLPPGLTAPWSVGRWGVAPLVERTGLAALPARLSVMDGVTGDNQTAIGLGQNARSRQAAIAPCRGPRCCHHLGRGCLVFCGAVAVRYAGSPDC